MPRVLNAVLRGKRPLLDPPGQTADAVMPPPLRALVARMWAQEPAARPKARACAASFAALFAPDAVGGLKVTAAETTADQVKAAAAAAEGNSADVFAEASPRTVTLAVQTARVILGANGAMLTIGELLAQCGLSRHLAALENCGYADVAMLADRELLDDETLVKVVGMSKLEVRIFRAKLGAAEPAASTFVSRLAHGVAVKADNAGLKGDRALGSMI